MRLGKIPMNEVGAAIEGLYRVTDKYRPTLENLEDQELRLLLTRIPRRNLQPETLAAYAASAILVVGGTDDYRYFLPRILELLTAGWATVIVSPETLIGRLRFAEWGTWPDAEQSAVRRVLASLWRTTLETYPSRNSVDAVLCGLGWAEDDLTPYLSAWARSIQPQAAFHLSDFLELNIQAIATSRKLGNQFWTSERTQQRRQVIDWIRGPAAEQTLRNGLRVAVRGGRELAIGTALERLKAL